MVATVTVAAVTGSNVTMAAPADTEDVEPALPTEWAQTLQWRCIGPANMGGRITAIAVVEQDPNTWWVATASGGLLKTTNNGVTFEHQFDHEATVSIGHVAVATSDPNVVWVGTGEANPRNSVSWGNGVYKSIDGGKMWEHMGLDKSFQIGRIAIHPADPNVVYVGALGRLWGPNEERGLYKTTDGGKTWEKILYVDDKTGVIDVDLKPDDPDTLLVASYQRKRDGTDDNDPIVKIGPGSRLFKSTDGGKSWDWIIQGLPSGNLGRMGIDFYRKDPNVVYMVLESERIGKEPDNAPTMGADGADAEVGGKITQVEEGSAAAKAGLMVGDIVVRVDDTTIHSYDELMKEMRKRVAGDTVKVEVSRQRKSHFFDLTFEARSGGAAEGGEDGGDEPGPAGGGPPGGGPPGRGRPARSPFSSGLGGQVENVHEQQGPHGHEFGGLYRSTDAGESWERINSVNPRPMYFSEVRIDPSDNNHIYVLGISLYRSKDGGATFTADGGRGAHPDHHALWIDPRDGRHQILGNDGGIYVTYDRQDHWDHLNHVAIGQFYHAAVDTNRNYRVYGGLQDNGSWGGPNRSRDGGGPINEDWFRVGGGDGFVCRVDPTDADQVFFESQNGATGRINFRTGERGFIRPQPTPGARYRFNWKTPFILSSHNPGIYYSAGNYVFKSVNRGEALRPISPEISLTDKGAASALAESYHDPNVL
ncbi:MAG: PDZ domain-containing protein, partial [Phycisphaerales bacterium]